MILADTSVWVEFLRRTGSRADRELYDLKEADPTAVVTTEPVAMEILAGPTDELTVRRLRRLIDGMPSLGLEPRTDFREAAAIQRACRRNGHTIRSLVDCLIAAVAIRHQATLWHRDADFDAIAEVTGLRHRPLH